MEKEGRKTEKITINLTRIENELLKLLANHNSKSEDNKTSIAYNLYKYGFIFFINQFSVNSKDDFQKQIKHLIKWNEGFNANNDIEKLFEQIKEDIQKEGEIKNV